MSDSNIEQLIYLLARLPGLGPRSAKRAALHLIKKRDQLMKPIAQLLQDVAENIKFCKICGNIDTSEICHICQDSKRDQNILIIVEDIADLWALERSMIIRAKYHVLGGHLSPLNGIGEDDLNLAVLNKRVQTENFSEVILALSATIEGQITAHYIKSLLKELCVKITQLAQGMPLGGELDYLDEGTLAQAIGRRTSL